MPTEQSNDRAATSGTHPGDDGSGLGKQPIGDVGDEEHLTPTEEL